MNFWSWNLYQFVTIINDSCDWLISGCHIKQLNEINEEESNSMLPKMFTPINLWMTQKLHVLTQSKKDLTLLKINLCTTTKHKINFSCPNIPGLSKIKDWMDVPFLKLIEAFWSNGSWVLFSWFYFVFETQFLN